MSVRYLQTILPEKLRQVVDCTCWEKCSQMHVALTVFILVPVSLQHSVCNGPRAGLRAGSIDRVHFFVRETQRLLKHLNVSISILWGY